MRSSERPSVSSTSEVSVTSSRPHSEVGPQACSRATPPPWTRSVRGLPSLTKTSVRGGRIPRPGRLPRQTRWRREDLPTALRVVVTRASGGPPPPAALRASLVPQSRHPRAMRRLGEHSETTRLLNGSILGRVHECSPSSVGRRTPAVVGRPHFSHIRSTSRKSRSSKKKKKGSCSLGSPGHPCRGSATVSFTWRWRRAVAFRSR